MYFFSFTGKILGLLTIKKSVCRNVCTDGTLYEDYFDNYKIKNVAAQDPEKKYVFDFCDIEIFHSILNVKCAK